jgi:hypothetical protein
MVARAVRVGVPPTLPRGPSRGDPRLRAQPLPAPGVSALAARDPAVKVRRHGGKFKRTYALSRGTW